MKINLRINLFQVKKKNVFLKEKAKEENQKKKTKTKQKPNVQLKSISNRRLFHIALHCHQRQKQTIFSKFNKITPTFQVLEKENNYGIQRNFHFDSPLCSSQ